MSSKILCRQKKSVIDPIYLPFSRKRLAGHFVVPRGRPENVRERYVGYYERSAARYHQFLREHRDRKGLSLSTLRRPCQIEKDERFWLAACLMKCFHASDQRSVIAQLLQRAFGDVPPLPEFASWADCMDGKLRLFFEVVLPSPSGYRQWLAAHLAARNVIPYVLDAAIKRGSDEIRADLEGPTVVDAILLNENNGFAVFWEAKVLSDISGHVSFDAARNQIARNIDVMLESNPNFPSPLDSRNPDRTLFALLTPELFRDNPSTRHYGMLLREYQSQPEALSRDLPHRDGVDWEALAHRLGWLTFEDCQNVLPGACAWLWRGRCGICNRPLDETGPGPGIRYQSMIQVCPECDSRAANANGEPARHIPDQVTHRTEPDGEEVTGLACIDDGDNPVFIDGIKCWRRYRFGGHVTFRDLLDCETLDAFYERTHAGGRIRRIGIQLPSKVLRHFDLEDARLIECGGDPERTLHWRIAHGDCDLCVRGRIDGDFDEREDLHRLQLWLAAEGAPVPPPIKAPDGSTVVRYAERLWYVTPWCGEKRSGLQKVALTEAGTLLARFHKIADQLEVKRPPGRGPLPKYLSKVKRKLAKGEACNPYLDRKQKICQEVEKRATAIRGWYRTSPKTFTHGDFCERNVLWQDDAPTALIDLELCGQETPLLDLCFFASECAKAHDAAPWRQVFDSLAEGYRSVLPLEDANDEMVELVLMLVTMHRFHDAPHSEAPVIFLERLLGLR